MRKEHAALDIAVALGVTVAIGALDYATGVELRIFPLYFIPTGFLAWRRGRFEGGVVSVFAIVAWEVSNRLAGMHPTSLFIDAWNVTVQFLSLVAFVVLLARVRDMVERERATSRSDPLTGLANSRAFFETLAPEIERSRRHRHPITLAYLDLDNFKQVNDTRGHQAGDEVLKTIAALLREGCRTGDTLARLGGDEFALILPETDVDQATQMLARVRERVSEEMSRRSLPVSASVGAVSALRTWPSAEELVQQADSLMYEAKAKGKNAIQVAPVVQDR